MLFRTLSLTRSGKSTQLLLIYIWNQVFRVGHTFIFIFLAFIEKNTWTGLEDFYTNLVQALHTECSEDGKQSTCRKSLRSRKRRKNRVIGPELGSELEDTQDDIEEYENDVCSNVEVDHRYLHNRKQSLEHKRGKY